MLSNSRYTIFPTHKYLAASLLWVSFFLFHVSGAQTLTSADSYNQLYKDFKTPPRQAKPWVFWYWMYASVSKAGITADLQAMKEAGIGGAYLMCIKDTTKNITGVSPVRQLSAEWWEMVVFAMKEAKRVGMELGMHVSDGFALAGGPWITPELSMQKLVWADTLIKGGQTFSYSLPQPEKNEDYYKDIAVYAYPTPADIESTTIVTPTITTSKGTKAVFLADKNNQQNFSSRDTCWIQYAFEKPFTCRSMVIRTNGNNYQSHRLLVEVSDDGKNFHSIGRLHPPRHGWQDSDADVTHAIKPTTARFFRFVYDPEGSEPGSEDLDAAKWSPSLKLRGIELSGAPRIHQYESKNGSVWRVSEQTTKEQLPSEVFIAKDKLLNITQYFSKEGKLSWTVPNGRWTIIRMGHTSTGHTNTTGGGGKGLECDKFNPAAVRLQFGKWFGEATRKAGPELTKEVLKVFHVDSWECGSQNWSLLFDGEFKKRRGYDILDFLPIMTGLPVQSLETSEAFLHDVRKTISELIIDQFYKTLATEAKKKGCLFSAESVAPTMLSDGLLHYQIVDLPMGEFWLRSPTHDKPNDMLDAISGAHIYGKKIVQAEAFTELRMAWDEHPAMLKTLADRNYALGINKLVYHVFTHNPWMNKKPGMTLDGIGLFFQRDQTWWKQANAWVEYAQRCQAILQKGQPVADIAVFTGEELPSRSVLPDRLVNTLPGIFGDSIVAAEKKRLANIGLPLRELPAGVRHSANMADPENWINPLNGYAYDSYNLDALLHLSSVKNGRVELPGGASFALLIIPGAHTLSPDKLMSLTTSERIQQMVKQGATVLIGDEPNNLPAINSNNDSDKKSTTKELWSSIDKTKTNRPSGKASVNKNGRLIKGAYHDHSFDAIGLAQDFTATEDDKKAEAIAFNHRKGIDYDVYFISNQRGQERKIKISLRQKGRIPELWNPVSGAVSEAMSWKMTTGGRTELPLSLAPNESLFIVLHKTTEKNENVGKNWIETKNAVNVLPASWQVLFDPKFGGPVQPAIFKELNDWSKNADSSIKYYSGTAVYSQEFQMPLKLNPASSYWIDLGEVANIASIKLNGKNCGIAWTHPYRLDITNALQAGKNKLTIAVTNTWLNRLLGDQFLSLEKRITNTTAPFKAEGKSLLPAGLLGPVQIIESVKK